MIIFKEGGDGVRPGRVRNSDTRGPRKLDRNQGFRLLGFVFTVLGEHPESVASSRSTSPGKKGPLYAQTSVGTPFLEVHG